MLFIWTCLCSLSQICERNHLSFSDSRRVYVSKQNDNHYSCFIQSVQLLSHVRLFATPRIAARQASLSITNSQNPPKPMSIESVMPSNHLILCCPLLLLPPIPPRIRVFSNESTLRKRWPKYWSFSFNISPSNEHPGLISFRMDWLDLLAVQGTLKSLLQHHSSKTSILWCSSFFTIQLRDGELRSKREEDRDCDRGYRMFSQVDENDLKLTVMMD